jgi:Ni2+-binding GTPase involved in maturation of urease and hydrogenase
VELTAGPACCVDPNTSGTRLDRFKITARAAACPADPSAARGQVDRLALEVDAVRVGDVMTPGETIRRVVPVGSRLSPPLRLPGMVTLSIATQPPAIAGDVYGDDDYRRIIALGIPAANVNTGKECHLDAHLVQHGLEDFPLDTIDILFIENVGNLICPGEFPLGAHKRVVVTSVTEGPYMIVKHPYIFREADVIVLNKIDLAKAMKVDPSQLERDAKRINLALLLLWRML